MARKKKRPAKRVVKSGSPSQQKNNEIDIDSTSSQKWWISVSVVLFFALFLRVGYLVEICDEPDFSMPWIDAAYHDVWARGIAFDDWSVPEGMNDPEIRTRPYFRPPGYAYFLAGIYKLSGGSYLAPRIVQMALGLLSTFLVMLLGRSLLGVRGAIIAGALFAGSWTSIHFEGQLMAPSLLITLGCTLILVLSAWCRKITFLNSFLAGLIFAAFALVRPNILLMGPIILAWGFYLGYRHNALKCALRGALGLCIAALLIIAPVTIRNYRVSGDLVLITSNAGINLHIGNIRSMDFKDIVRKFKPIPA